MYSISTRLLFIPLLAFYAGCQSAPKLANSETAFLVADLLDVSSDAGSISGEPQRIHDQEVGAAVLFDGVDDAIFLNENPLLGLSTFTVEVLFRPDDGGSDEPRFLHVGTVSKDRMMLETRNADGRWALDSFFRHGEDYLVLLDEAQSHPLGEWAHLAVVMEEGKVKNYVNGELELVGELDFAPIQEGGMSIGVRMNKVHWFKGAIHSIRVTPRVLDSDAFMQFTGNDEF